MNPLRYADCSRKECPVLPLDCSFFHSTGEYLAGTDTLPEMPGIYRCPHEWEITSVRKEGGKHERKVP